MDLAWQDGNLTRARLLFLLRNPCKLRLGDKFIDLKTSKGNFYTFDGLLPRL